MYFYHKRTGSIYAIAFELNPVKIDFMVKKDVGENRNLR